MRVRALQGLGDTIYSDSEGNSIVAPDGSDEISEYNTTTQDAGAVAGAAGKAIGNALSGLIPDITIPWWVWIGGAGVLFLALHHEFKK